MWLRAVSLGGGWWRTGTHSGSLQYLHSFEIAWGWWAGLVQTNFIGVVGWAGQ